MLFQRLAIALLLVTGSSIAVYAHKHPSYERSARPGTSNPDWMKEIPDDTRISELSIPGSHETMSRFGGNILECQSMTLWDQLISGIRVLDVRCRHYENTFRIYHGFVSQKATFDDVLNVLERFLKEHPSETVLMRVKEEHYPYDSDRAFDETFRLLYWNKRPNTFWHPRDFGPRFRDNPKLKDLRGKVVVLQDFFREADPEYGIRYASFDIQDEHKLASNYNLYDKWTWVLNYLRKAAQGNKEQKYMNYLSGSGGSFPYFVASGHSSPGTGDDRLRSIHTGFGSWQEFPRINQGLHHQVYFEGTNTLTYNRIVCDIRGRVGILMADFPGPGLIDETIRLNDPLRQGGPGRPPVPAGCGDWENMSGLAKDIGVGADGSAWVIGFRDGSYGAFKWNGLGWQEMYNQRTLRIDVDKDGAAWIVNARQEIFRRDKDKDHWVRIPGPKALDIGVGATGSVWITTHEPAHPNKIYKLDGNEWHLIAGLNAKRIDVDKNGDPWAVDLAGRIWRRDNGNWKEVPGRGQQGRATDIGIGGDGSVFIIGTNKIRGGFPIFKWSGDKWQGVAGAAEDISVDNQGVPWVVNGDRWIFRRRAQRP